MNIEIHARSIFLQGILISKYNNLPMNFSSIKDYLFKFNNKLMSLNIVFMGTSEFSVPTLHALIKNKFNVFKVYTQPPKKSKRGLKVNPSPIEEFCEKNKID